MKAIRQHTYGGPDVLRLEEIPDPEPREGQVRIAVEAIGVHLLDTAIRAGTSFGMMGPPDFPMTPGREVAGTVDALGPGTDPEWSGRRVVVHLGVASGGYAELAVAPVDQLFTLPDHVTTRDAVAMVGNGRTALAILEVANITAQDTVLVTAAAGGLGALLTQAARQAGATVVGAAGGPHKVATLQERGVDVAVDYSVDGWDDDLRQRLGTDGVTVVLDGVGGSAGTAAFELVRPGGRLVLFGYSSGEQLQLDAEALFRTGVTATAAIGARMAARPGGIRGLAADALEALADGRLTPLVNPPFALADAADAHRALEDRQTVGKVVLVP